MGVALPRASGLGARLLRGRLRTVTPQRPVPFPDQGPPFGLLLLFVGDIYTRPESDARGDWGCTPSRDQTKFIFRISAETCRRVPSWYFYAFSPEHWLGSLALFFQFPESCRLAWWTGGRAVLRVGVEPPVL